MPHRVLGTIEDWASTLHLPLYGGGREGAVSISRPLGRAQADDRFGAFKVPHHGEPLDGVGAGFDVEHPIGAIHGEAEAGAAHRVFDQVGGADGGRDLVVVDYKTGRWVPGRDDVASSLALAVYAAAARRTLRARSVRVELHHLPSGTRVGLTHEDAAVTRHLARADSIGAEARDAEARWQADLAPLADAAAHGEVHAVDAIDAVLPPRPGSLCGWCDFRRYCPEGSEAAPAKLPWDAVLSDPPAEVPIPPGG